MKKTYLARHRTIFPSENSFWGAGTCALIFSILLLLVRVIAPNAFDYITAPVFHLSNSLSENARTFFARFNNAETLFAEKDRLAAENAALTFENQALQMKLSSVSKLADIPNVDIVAGIVSRPPTNPYDMLTLAAGKNHGVKLGMEVFSRGNIPIGIVSSVLDNFSRVTLFSAPGTATDGWVEHSGTNIPMVFFGMGGGSIQATISRSAGITENDVALVPGPGMLPMGKVIRVNESPSVPSVTIYIALEINLFSIDWVALRDIGTNSFMSATSTFP